MTHIALLKEHPECASVLASWAFKEWYKNRSIDFDLVLKAYKARINDSQIPIAWIAIEDGMPAGMVSLKDNDLWSRKDLNPWLASLFVLPEYRKRGIGAMLIHNVIEKARALGLVRLYLFADPANITLGNYYSKKGWVLLEEAKGNEGKIVKIYLYNLS